MMKRILFWGPAVVLGLAVGVGSALGVMALGAQGASVKVGQWTINRLAGSAAADPYTRAVVARVGLLALAQSETIYFQLSSDEDGAPLRDDCIYELSGAEMPARWWAVTIYASDNYLPLNDDDAFSVDATTIERNPDGRWTALVQSGARPGANWISANAAGSGYTLTLRLYNPANEARAEPATVRTPAIRTVSCAGGAP
jgi:hypothetical protein